VDLDRDILEYLAEERADLPIAGDNVAGRHRRGPESGPNPE
jgi:hypothetical protein